MQAPAHTLDQLQKDGFSILPSVLPENQIQQIIDAVEAARTQHSAPGLRNLLQQSPPIRNLALSGTCFKLASMILGQITRPVRAILFDKTPSSNWYVTWHQDLSIPVKERIDCDGFGPWSTKHGITHVQPPAHILENMVSLRIHLDPCTEDNGAIKFIPGSHTSGIRTPDLIAHWRDTRPNTICPARRGDILLMRPLILHSSSTSQNPDHRRVLHLEYAGIDLPAGLQWAEA